MPEPMFNVPPATPMPTLACVGRVLSVDEANVSKSGLYIVQPISLEGYGVSRSARVNLLYRPEWLRPGFNPIELAQLEGGQSMIAVYARNIASSQRTPVLLGLCGCDHSLYAKLAREIFSLPEETVTDKDKMREFFARFFSENQRTIGYILRQQTSDTGEFDEHGRPIRRLEPFYEVSGWFNPTDDKQIRQLIRRAEKANGKFKVMFSEEDLNGTGVPF